MYTREVYVEVLKLLVLCQNLLGNNKFFFLNAEPIFYFYLNLFELQIVSQELMVKYSYLGQLIKYVQNGVEVE